jgi:signal transduction histidine kinase
VRIEDLSDGKEFITSPDVASFSEVKNPQIRRVWTPEFKTGELHGVEFAAITLKSHRYLLLFHSAPFQELQLKWLSPMTVLILLILFANFLLIRWLFRPVAWLSDGIRRLGQGDFDVQVPCRSYDELGDLAISFNETVGRVRQIVESKRQLLLDVSHELRSPLTRIRVALELSGPKAQEHIKKNVLILESMIHELLESARLESAQSGMPIEEFDLADILRTAVAAVDETDPGVVFADPGRPLFLRGDRKQVETCTKNVLDNALKYSKQQSEPVRVSVERNGDQNLCVHIRDFGLGIPANEREMIFEPFYRVDKSRLHETGGYGLGLSLCRKIMSAHGGKILVTHPKSGQGSVFTLDFPLRPQAAEAYR